MPKIRQIKIKNFRSVREFECATTDLTIIVGNNDSGKSNILRALNLFFNGETNPGMSYNFDDDFNRYAETRAKKAKEIEIELRMELPEAYRENNGDLISWAKWWRVDGIVADDQLKGIRREKKKRGEGFIETEFELPSRSRVRPLLNRIQFEYVPAVRSSEFFRGLRGRIFKVIAQASEPIVRGSSGQFEKVIGEVVGDLLSDIATELKDDARLQLPNDLTALFESLDFLSGEKSIALDSRGDGIKARYIPLILKFIADKSKVARGISPTFIWAYEEPENNLEFRSAQALATAFKKLARDDFSQVILTTHSPIFYNMHQDDGETGVCSAYHVSNTGSDTGTLAASVREATVSLDESMGTMAIVAPHIKVAQQALLDVNSQVDDLRRKLAALNRDNLPTLFVEGATEYLIFGELLKRYRPERGARMFMAEPPTRAGANYVTNMLRSWEYRMKHIPTADRRRAAGIVDADSEGVAAAKRFEEDTRGRNYVEVVAIRAPEHLVGAVELGIEIPICFEELWPKDAWDDALRRRWLADRPKKGLIGARLTERLAEDDVRLSDLIEDDWKIYLEKNVSPEVGVKTQWAQHMIKTSERDLAIFASEHLKLLDRALDSLKV